MLLFAFQLLFFILSIQAWGAADDIFLEANKSYKEGIIAKTFDERIRAFNHALFLYRSLEDELNSSMPSSLDLAIGNTYFQLNEYPWAVLYYERGLKKAAHDPLLRSHLKKAREELGIPLEISSSSTIPSIFNAFLLTSAQQSILLLVLFFLSFLLCSIAIWLPRAWTYKLSIYSLSLLVIGFMYAIFVYYSTPVEGILIKSTGFYRAPDFNQPQLAKNPLLAGSKVKILQMTEQENWVKIANEAGTIGYVPVNSLQMI